MDAKAKEPKKAFQGGARERMNHELMQEPIFLKKKRTGNGVVMHTFGRPQIAGSLANRPGPNMEY